MVVEDEGKKQSLWYQVLAGDRRKSSAWWVDLCSLEGLPIGSSHQRFRESLNKVVVNGENSLFWKEP